MKKLMILMLVFGLASLANAALIGIELSVDGVTDGPDNVTAVELPICETIEIDIHGIADDYAAIIVISDPAFDPDDPLGHGGEWGDDIGPPYYEQCNGYYYEEAGYPTVAAAAGDMASAVRWELANYGFGYEATAADSSASPTAGLHFEFLYHCCGPESEYVTITLYNKYTVEVEDTIVIHQTPEPMTVALLGLGGLLLRRRR